MLVSIGKRQRTGELVESLLECHGRIREFCELARALGQRRDLAASDVVDGCARVERYFVEALPLHVEDEERSILPRLQGRRADLDQALLRMQAEHEQHQHLLAELLSACRALAAAPELPRWREALTSAALALSQEFEPHLRLEELLIFPELGQLSEAERGIIKQELRARRDRAP
jgi:iron-sulfur cluster repair protein YtfE (RIC family)